MLMRRAGRMVCLDRRIGCRVMGTCPIMAVLCHAIVMMGFCHCQPMVCRTAIRRHGCSEPLKGQRSH